MPKTHAQSWLALQCQMIPGVRRGILLTVLETGFIAPSPTALWPDSAHDATPLVEAGHHAFKARRPVVLTEPQSEASASQRPSIVACPLMQQDRLIGVVVLEVNSLDQQQQHTLLQLLNWGAAWLGLLRDGEQKNDTPETLQAVVDATSAVLDSRYLDLSLNAVTNTLAQTFTCDRVSVGLLKRREARIAALSHSAVIDRRSDLLRSIEAAMEEALDEASTINVPCADDARHLPAHKVLCDANSRGAVCTVLLRDSGRPIGALALERTQGPAFDTSTVNALEAISTAVGPIIELKRLNERSEVARAADSLKRCSSSVLGPEHLTRKLVALSLAGLLAWLTLATGQHRVAADAVLEGVEQRALIAPIDGFVRQAFARAGERVQQHDVVATLDDRDLILEKRRLSSELDDLQRRHDRAIGSMDRAEAAIIAARIGKTKAQYDLVKEQLARTRITAPIDGVLVSGDLSRSLGAPVARGDVLFELAPLGAYRMALQIHENDIGHIAPGQRGHLVLAAMPDERLSFEIEDIIGVAKVADGANGFRVEARLLAETDTVRPGMRGVGKIEIGERSLLWIWTHALRERLSLWLWSHAP